eukprot:GEMP01052152.1.p1 GENE.GEMP01052152.1~~GEMP01052152.1.p1  ORF type:complete len:229 (+),score=15.98 GEMP01052152.1:217-903(+)
MTDQSMHMCWAQRVDREQQATLRHLFWIHPDAAETLPKKNYRDSSQTVSELLSGSYRMPVSIMGSRRKRFVLRGLGKPGTGSSDISIESSTTYHSGAASSAHSHRPKAVDSAARSTHSGFARSVRSTSPSVGRSKNSDVLSRCGSATLSQKSKSVDQAASVLTSKMSRSLTSLRCKSTTESASVARSDVQKMVTSQVSELLKPLRHEIELSKQARIAAEKQLRCIKQK